VDLTALLAYTAEKGASDLHLSAGVPPLLRVHGEMVPVPEAGNVALTHDLVLGLIFSVLDDKQRVAFESTKDIDFSIAVKGVGRFRGNAFVQLRGPGAVFRVIPEVVPSFDKLGLPSVLRDLALKEKGLVLVTGPTGSGKSTTLAAMLDLVNQHRAGHVITIEDPVEFVHQPKRCLVNQREVGTHTESFASALRAALREDPDVLLVGEMRDLETIALAITAAETGHLVFGTLHTSGAPKTVDRVVNVFPMGQQEQIRTVLSGSIQGIVSQALLPRADKPGRVAVHEVLVATPAVRALIRQLPTAIQTGARFGMCGLEQSLTAAVMAGRVDRAVAENYLVELGLAEGQPNRHVGGAGQEAVRPARPIQAGPTAPPGPARDTLTSRLDALGRHAARERTDAPARRENPYA